jgi:Ala-tRNA(Pro) deacylase
MTENDVPDAILDPETRKRKALEVLDGLGIRTVVHEHPPVFTVEQTREHWRDIKAGHCKNLFLRNNKGDRHYLVIALIDTRVELKMLTRRLDEDRLGFASAERLRRFLGVEAGSVSPFGLLHSEAREVRVVLDARLNDHPVLAFHPNVNTATVEVAFDDVMKFLKWCGNDIRMIHLQGGEL